MTHIFTSILTTSLPSGVNALNSTFKLMIVLCTRKTMTNKRNASHFRLIMIFRLSYKIVYLKKVIWWHADTFKMDCKVCRVKNSCSFGHVSEQLLKPLCTVQFSATKGHHTSNYLSLCTFRSTTSILSFCLHVQKKTKAYLGNMTL